MEGASEVVVATDWVDMRDPLEARVFLDREDFVFLPGGLANTKKEQSGERR